MDHETYLTRYRLPYDLLKCFAVVAESVLLALNAQCWLASDEAKLGRYISSRFDVFA